MTVHLHHSNWKNLLCGKKEPVLRELRIMCPFISRKAIRCILSPHNPALVKVVTRFNVKEFCEGVNDLGALEMLLKQGASVRGIRNLHAKLYVFGNERAIITSANLTWAALTKKGIVGGVA